MKKEKRQSKKLVLEKDVLIYILGGEVDADGTMNPKPETIVYSSWPGC